MPTTLLQNPSMSQSLRTIPRAKKRTSMSWTTQLSASSLRLRKGWVCCCNVKSRSAMSCPTRRRRSWSSLPKLMKSTKLVSTCERSKVGRQGARVSMWSIHTVVWMWHHRRATTDTAAATTVLYNYTSTRLAHQLLGQRDHLIPIVAILVVAPEKTDCARERRGLVVLDGSAAAVQEERVQQRHGQWPQHDEADCKGND
eukprot:scaffold15455_cov69-Phaeocystis_antarctica.AAC.4